MTEGLTTAVSGAMNTVKSDVFDLMGTALPIGLAIMGAVLAITLGVKFFKRVAK